LTTFEHLVEIVARLRGDGGCPWDRAQTEASMRPYVLEETYEVLDAIDRGDDTELRNELGDVLFQVVLLAQMATERGAFTLEDVVAGISEKMIRRHPHVFGDEPTETNTGIEAWERRKAKERSSDESALDGVPTALPALLRAHRISEKASRVGFDWKTAEGVRKKLDEEVAELDQAIADLDSEQQAEELGDVLFTLVNLGRHLPVGAETSLRLATSRFERRFRRLEQSLSEDGLGVHDVDVTKLEDRWRAMKETR
jgi:MazG family protein